MKRHARRAVPLVVAALAVAALTAGPALAQDAANAPRDQIVLTGRLVVAADETVGAAVILDGPAQVDGTVRGPSWS